MTPGGCPVCGATHAVCGAAAAPVTPFDIPTTVRRPTVADKAWYEIPARGHTTVAKYTSEEAEALYGDAAKRVGDAKQAEPQPVGRPPYDTGEVKDPADQDDDADVKKAPSPRNKARHSDDK